MSEQASLEDKLEERMVELHAFLQGTLPDGVQMKHKPKLSPETAMNIIWFLQEFTKCLPDRYEMCCVCKSIYDSNSDGDYDEKTAKHYCVDKRN